MPPRNALPHTGTRRHATWQRRDNNRLESLDRHTHGRVMLEKAPNSSDRFKSRPPAMTVNAKSPVMSGAFVFLLHPIRCAG